MGIRQFPPRVLAAACIAIAVILRAGDPVRAQTGVGISDPAYRLLNARSASARSSFLVYEDVDSGLNRGFPSGLWGNATGKLHWDAGCVYSATAMSGCAKDPGVMDKARGTVFRLSFDPLGPGEFVGLNFEEPEHWGGGVTPGRAYDLRGATKVVIDAVSPSGDLHVQFGVAGSTTAFVTIPRQWTTISIDLATLGVSPAALADAHLLFGIASNDRHAPAGGTILLDNIRFQPVPKAYRAVLALPLSNQVFGVIHVQDRLPGRIPIPSDQVDANLSTLYESSLVVLALLNRGQTQDLANARRIADALVYALGHDNQGDPLPAAPDGSRGLHNANASGDIALFNGQGPGAGQQGQVRLAGFSAVTLCPTTGYCLVLDGATGGNNAFAILALVAAYNRFGDRAYLDAAVTIGNWIYGNLRDTSGTGYGGYFLGYPDEGQIPKTLLTGKSVENNADIFRAFTAIAEAEAALSDPPAAGMWTGRANIAGDFVMQMFDTATGHFFAGTVPSGQPPAPGIYPYGPSRGGDVINTFDFIDAQTFTTLALASSPRYRIAIDWHLPVDWMLTRFARSVTVKKLTFNGFDLIAPADHLPGDGPAGVAWEFTAQAVVTMQFVDDLYGTSTYASSSDSYLGQIRQAQQLAPFHDGRGLVAATLQGGDRVPPYQQCLVTPFQCVPQRVGLAASAWAIFAERHVNPLSVGVSMSSSR